VPAGTNTNQITLSWVGSPGATGYNIYRGTSSGSEQLLASVAAASTSTTLAGNSGGIDATQTTINVASASGFPGSGDYDIIVDGEEMTVTGGQGTTTWTVTRGTDCTTGAAHSDGAAVLLADQSYVDDTNATPSGNQPTADTSGGGGEYAVVAASYPAGASSWSLTDFLLRGHPAGATVTVFNANLWGHCAVGFGLASAATKTSAQLLTAEWELEVSS